MPRIAAALGLVATVAFCIGFNVQRYPLVWEMTAPGHIAGAVPADVAQATPASKTAKPAAKEGKTAHHKIPADHAPAANFSAKEETESSDNRLGTSEGARHYAALHPIPIAEPSDNADSVTPAANGTSQPRHDPVAALPESKYGAAASGDTVESSGPKPAKTKAPPKRKTGAKRTANGAGKKNSPNDKPAARPMVPFGATAAGAREGYEVSREPVQPLGSETGFRRLPPVDPYQTNPEDPYASMGAGSPSYPTTGVQ